MSQREREMLPELDREMDPKLMSQDKEQEVDDVVSRIGRLTQSLLEDGAEPAQVAFALTSVAADMGLQITGDPLKVFPVLLSAIAHQASRRCESERQLDGTQLEFPPGVTVH
jgi:hypothetical protein